MELYDIKGYWNMDFSDKFKGAQSWHGQIVVDEDGWFEGVVVDKDSSYKENRFICGIFHPGLVFELYKLTPLSISNPFVFHCGYKEGGYEGGFEAISLLSSTTVGMSRICVREVKGSQDEISNGFDYLNGLIEANKKEIFDDTCSTFYENAYLQRKALSKIILKNYLGQTYTKEEIDDIMADIKPIRDKIIDETIDEASSKGKRIKFSNKHGFYED